MWVCPRPGLNVCSPGVLLYCTVCINNKKAGCASDLIEPGMRYGPLTSYSTAAWSALEMAMAETVLIVTHSVTVDWTALDRCSVYYTVLYTLITRWGLCSAGDFIA